MKYSAATYLGFGIPIGFFSGFIGGWQTVWFIWIVSIILAIIAYSEDRHTHGYTTILDTDSVKLTDEEFKVKYGFDKVTWLKEWELKEAMDNYKRLHNLMAQSNGNLDRFKEYLFREKMSNDFENKINTDVVKWEHDGTECVRPYIYFAEEYEHFCTALLSLDEQFKLNKRIQEMEENDEPFRWSKWNDIFDYYIPNKEKGFVKIYI